MSDTMISESLDVTQWFYAEPPANVGVYQRLVNVPAKDYIFYSYWDGKNWYVLSSDTEEAYGWYTNSIKSNVQSSLPWRGVVKKN